MRSLLMAFAALVVLALFVSFEASPKPESGLAARVALLEAQLAILEPLLVSLSLEDGGATIRFTGVNVQVVDGSGDTGGATNGLGNLIVGYIDDNSGA